MKTIHFYSVELSIIVFCLSLPLLILAQPLSTHGQDAPHQDTLTLQGDQFVSDEQPVLDPDVVQSHNGNEQPLIGQIHSHDHITESRDHQNLQDAVNPDQLSSLLQDPHPADQQGQVNTGTVGTAETSGSIEGDVVGLLPHESVESMETEEISLAAGQEREGDIVAPEVDIEHHDGEGMLPGTGHDPHSQTDVDHIHGRRNLDDLQFSTRNTHLTTRTTTTANRQTGNSHEAQQHGQQVRLDNDLQIDNGVIDGSQEPDREHGEDLLGNNTHSARTHHENPDLEPVPGASVSRIPVDIASTTPYLSIDHANADKYRNHDTHPSPSVSTSTAAGSILDPDSEGLRHSNLPVLEPTLPQTTGNLVILPTPTISNETERHEDVVTPNHRTTPDRDHEEHREDLHPGNHHGNEETEIGHGNRHEIGSRSFETDSVENGEPDTNHTETLQGNKPNKQDTDKEPVLNASTSLVDSVTTTTAFYASSRSIDRDNMSTNKVQNSISSAESTLSPSSTKYTESTSLFSSTEFFEASMDYDAAILLSDLSTTPSTVMTSDAPSSLDYDLATKAMEIPNVSQGLVIDQSSISPSLQSYSVSVTKARITSKTFLLESTTMTPETKEMTEPPSASRVSMTTLPNSESPEMARSEQKVTSASQVSLSSSEEYSTHTLQPVTEEITEPYVTSNTTGVSTQQPFPQGSTRPALTVSMTTNKKDEPVASSTTPTVVTRTKESSKATNKPAAISPTTRSTSLLSTLFTPGKPTPAVWQLPVYLQIQMRMSWHVFCDRKLHFFAQLKDIIWTEKKVTVDEEQFHITNIPTQQCDMLSSGPAAMIEPDEMDEMETIITVEMYIADQDGKVNIRLTVDVSNVIIKGFQDSPSFFQGKILGVQLHKREDSVVDSRRPAPKEDMSTGITMVIVIASVGGCCCVVLVILQLVMMHRRIQAKKLRPFLSHRASLQSLDHVALGVIPKHLPHSGYWNPALDTQDEELENMKFSHLVNFFSLANFCMDLPAIHEEFQSIPFEAPDPSSMPMGDEDKNRFANVLPIRRTRVRLKKRPGDTSDYINANYVTGYRQEKSVYIATQSPLVNTVEDFWRLIWEQQSRAILMINPVMSTGKVTSPGLVIENKFFPALLMGGNKRVAAEPKQSTCYWPDDFEYDSRREYGDYVVSLKRRQVHQDYIECTLEIMDIERNLKREVHHFWLTCWPDPGTLEPLSLVKFVLDTRPHYENSGAPAVVHCGPGTGRTGVLIAVDTCMRMIEHRRCVDILNRVFKMRAERAGLVQTKEQYALIYQALNEYAVILGSPSVSTRSSVITLHAML